MNRLRTAILLGALTGLLMLIGGMFGGRTGIVIAFSIAVVMNFASYWFSDRFVLSLYRARPVAEQEAPKLYGLVRELSLRAGLPMPRVAVIPGKTPNAFATGRDEHHAVIAVTEGILELLSRDELAGVLSHELTHVKNRDILIGSVAATLAGAVMLLANMARWAAIFGIGGDDDDGGGIIGLLVTAIVAPIAAMMIQMAVSRSREYMADEGGARISGNPGGLASALEKLSQVSRRAPMKTNPSTAHLFIVNPLKAQSMAMLFSTHPPIEKRIERLRRMAGRPAMP